MLRFRNADGSVRQLRDAEAVWAELHQHVQGAFIHFIVHQKQDVLKILREWISATGGDDATAWRLRAELGQRRHLLEFSNHTDMARALLGEFLGRMALDDSENELGAATVQSAWVRAHLRALVEKLRLKIAQPTSPAVFRDLLAGKATVARLEYQPLYRKPGASLSRVMKDPDAYHFEDLVVTLHDLASAIEQLSKGFLEVPRDQCKGTYFRINERGEAEYSRRVIPGTEAFRAKTKGVPDPHYTLTESSGFVMAARVQGMPIWAGPSFTTARLMKMAEWAGASGDELVAMAWGIFGFWNQCYPTTSTWVHRFHEVMDMAANWGVPFEPFAYPRSAPPGHRNLRPKL